MTVSVPVFAGFSPSLRKASRARETAAEGWVATEVAENTLPWFKAAICATGLLFITDANGQWWSDAGIEIDAVGEIGLFYLDSTTNELYSTGVWVYHMGQPDQSLRYLIWDGTSWSLSVPLDNVPYTIVNYHDTLYLGGDFTGVNGLILPKAACMADGVWQSCGSFNDRVSKFKVIDDELYAVGPFSMINGLPCQGVAKRVGNGWECVGELNCSACLVADIIRYQDRLVISGSIAFGSNPYHHIMQYMNGSWVPVGPGGIYGGLSGGGQLAVFQGELYVGGLIPLSAGNAGFAIQKWNGSAWSQVGEGVQDETGGAVENIKVKDLLVHDGKLYVCGGFTYAGHVYAPRIATWDGIEWCSIGGDFGENEVTAMAFYNDTLYIACGLDAIVDGQQVVGVAKFIAPEFENNCSGNEFVHTISAGSVQSLVPVGGRLYRLEGGPGPARITVFDALGRELIQTTVMPGDVFTLAGAAHGMLFARLPNGGIQRLVVLE